MLTVANVNSSLSSANQMFELSAQIIPVRDKLGDAYEETYEYYCSN